MKCDYFDARICRSCALLEVPYADQLARAQRHLAEVLSAVPADAWQEPVASAEEGFRNKAKMVVGGTVEAPSLGILGPDRTGVDLTGCALHTPGIRAALPVLERFVTRAGLTPYSVPHRRGELKHVLVTESPDGELMVRWVLRSSEPVARLRKHLPSLQAELPGLVVASANLQPEHKAVLEGPEEIMLTEQQTLTMRLNGLPLHLRPQSFFQTNTEVAAALYRHARELVASTDAVTVWDLYCGVGGFALHLAADDERRAGNGPSRIVGVEASVEAIHSARTTSAELGLTGVDFVAGDATAYALEADRSPDLVVVNPPRRGIGPQLARMLEESAARQVLYSSCRAESLAADLARMPSLRPVSARMLDMFPHTEHHEVLVLLERR
ncbi:23S rRNA (uracil(747)-C(5))-methyltransferase RlmC [Nocardioides insulae]|uniref:23S rRNA (uracil(747)-C(5))-methyltransferase RlmC n=1 Tax=Nocardioides insulae TaxID=394734 RepID=UPI000420874D|nr:23S rRNA (uracil(747)-C(5))-methyltransferase RlmC [Nocardioides insulae]